MTASEDLLARVRANLNEVTGIAQEPQRTDAQIYTWLDDAQKDYVSKIPSDAVPELLTTTPVTGAFWTLATDYVKLVQVEVSHTISGSVTATEHAYIVNADEGWMPLLITSGIGAWAQFTKNGISIGPQAYAGVVSYIKNPTALSTTGVTFALGSEHEEPVVNRATALACYQINDEDSKEYNGFYEARIQAEKSKYGMELEVEPMR